MKNIVITQDPEENFTGLDVWVINPMSANAVVPSEWMSYAQEFAPFLISSEIEDQSIPDFNVFIDAKISAVDKYLLSAHLLCTPPATVFFFTEDAPDLLLRELDYGIFKNSAISIFSASELSAILIDDDESVRINKKFWGNFDYHFFKRNFQRAIEYDGHQATNEWAAIRFLLNHGKTLADIETIFSFPRTVLFKQKLKEFGISQTIPINHSASPLLSDINAARAYLTSMSAHVSSILLIDDNAAKGWKAVVEELFPGKPVVVKHNFAEANAIVNYSNYDLILLDLRLPFDSVSSTADIENGLKLVDKIKGAEASLEIPLLVLTASQKASTMNLVQQKGADGFYVKEAMHFTSDQSLKNYLELLTKIANQLAKGKALADYWKAIVEIKSNFIAEIANTSGILFKDRIIERLEMFYGLLKTSHEQVSYNDKKFHFSSDILAFMTLWSVLNDIQECYYDKNVGSSRTTVNNSIGAAISISLGDWRIKGQTPEKYLFREKIIVSEGLDNSGARLQPLITDVRRENFSNIKKDRRAPFFSMVRNFTKCAFNPKQVISMQIAYLLLNKTTVSSSSRIPDYLGFLNNCNQIRNALYLTHGEDLASSFHRQLERDKNLPPAAIPELFSVVCYLLTGDDSIF